MHSPLINYFDPFSILIINREGKMRQVFVPFPVVVLHDTSVLKKNSRVRVDKIQAHEKFKMLYKVTDNWWPYYLFKIQVSF